jgi:hypothetical protein
MKTVVPFLPLATNRDFIFFVLLYHFVIASILFPRFSFLSLSVLLLFLKNPKNISMVIRQYYKFMGLAFFGLTLYVMASQLSHLFEYSKEFRYFRVETNSLTLFLLFVKQVCISGFMLWNCHLLVQMRNAY